MMNTRTRNRFQRGSGCFQCQSCKRQTRATGGDNEQLKLCTDCFEMASWENTANDAEPNSEEQKHAEEMVAKYKAQAIAKGGTL